VRFAFGTANLGGHARYRPHLVERGDAFQGFKGTGESVAHADRRTCASVRHTCSFHQRIDFAIVEAVESRITIGLQNARKALSAHAPPLAMVSSETGPRVDHGCRGPSSRT